MRFPDRFQSGPMVSAVVDAPVMDGEDDVFGVYTGTAWVINATTFDKNTVSTSIFNQTIDVVILYTGETDSRELEAGDPVTGILYPIRDEVSGWPLLLVAPGKRC